MISSLIKRIQKTLKPGEITGDALDDLAFEALNQKPEKPVVMPEPLVLKPEIPKPLPKPPKPEAVVKVKPIDSAVSIFTSEAKKWLNVHEIGGPNKGADVEVFQKAVDGKASGEPWCCAFVWYCIMESQKQFAKRYTATPLSSWLYKTEHVLTMWNLSPKEARRTAPKPGALVIWQHLDAAGNQTARGHVGIVIEVIDKTFMTTVEGNTANDTVVEDEGDGVYMLKRNYKEKLGNKRIVGFLMPWKES